MQEQKQRHTAEKKAKTKRELQQRYGRPYWRGGGSEEKHVLTDGTEKEAVTAAFLKSLPSTGVTVIQVERLQNPTLWDMFATTRRTMLQRDGANDTLER